MYHNVIEANTIAPTESTINEFMISQVKERVVEKKAFTKQKGIATVLYFIMWDMLDNKNIPI
ncbi:MAG TPA: hypothetical protein VHF08_04605 [Nitrososphaeraceae archaeon]|nr:hypothetical protein [Nitrososphaeraceae archaeon]